MKRRRTKRAPDAGDSAAISSSFTRLSIFLVGRLRRPRPHAGTDYLQCQVFGMQFGKSIFRRSVTAARAAVFLFPAGVSLFSGTLRRPRTHLSESGNIRFCSMSDFGSPPVNENENCAEKTPFPFPGGVSPFYQNQLWRERAVLPLTG